MLINMLNKNSALLRSISSVSLLYTNIILVDITTIILEISHYALHAAII